jgi:hypothetical protein
MNLDNFENDRHCENGSTIDACLHSGPAFVEGEFLDLVGMKSRHPHAVSLHFFGALSSLQW